MKDVSHIDVKCWMFNKQVNKTEWKMKIHIFHAKSTIAFVTVYLLEYAIYVTCSSKSVIHCKPFGMCWILITA